MKTIKNMVVLATLVFVAPFVSADEDDAPSAPAAPPSVEEMAAGICAGCHGADGNSIIPMNPILAGQKAEYITKQLLDFKANGEQPPHRNSPVMSAMVAALTQEDAQKLGEYYANQKLVPSQIPGEENLLEMGKILYHGGNIENQVPACAGCHGPTGSGIPPRYPALAGQHKDYTMNQLGLFNSGERGNDNGVMQKVVSRMNPQEKRAVSEYIATLR